MKLVDLVRRTRELLDDFGGDNGQDWRVHDRDCAATNVQLTAHLTEAAKEYCRRVPLRDALDPGVCEVTVLGGGDGRVTIDPRVLAVRRVMPDGARRELLKRDLAWMRQYRSEWEAETGDPKLYLDDETEGVLRVVPVPTADLVLRLTVERLPLDAFDWALADVEVPEIPVQDQDALKYWAAKLVREAADSALHDTEQAKWMERLFERYVGPRPSPGQVRFRRWANDRRPRARGYF